MIIEERLKQQEHFSEVEKVIADYLLEQKEKLRDQSARHIAGQTYTSPASIVRLCKRLGYKGYPDFKEDYLKEIAYLRSHFQTLDANYPFESKDSPLRVANKLSALYKEFLDDTLELITAQQLHNALNVLKRCRVIHVISVGAHAHLAYPFQEKMMKIGMQVDISQSMDIGYYQASIAPQDECFLFLSYSGEIDGILRIAQKAKSRRLPTICFTSYGSNRLSCLCDHTFYVSTRETLIANIGTYGIYLSVLYLFDVLYSACFNLNYEGNLADKINISREYQLKRHSENPILMEDSFNKQSKAAPTGRGLDWKEQT